jgi:predicted O-methyltransferase YrrM
MKLPQQQPQAQHQTAAMLPSAVPSSRKADFPAAYSLKELAHEIGQKVSLLKEDRSLSFYEGFFVEMRDRPLNILEVGVYQGGSLLMFGKYFSNARILGIDLSPPDALISSEIQNSDLRDRVAVALGSQDNPAFLRSAITNHFGSMPLDVVIDDASHFYEQTRATFESVFYSHLRSGGLYIIEDWGAGYWPKWPDGDSDGRHGLPRLVKELVDEVALRDRTVLYEGERALPVEHEHASAIKQITVQPSIVVIEKA